MRLHHHHGLLLGHDEMAEVVAHVGQDVLGGVEVQALMHGGRGEPQPHGLGVTLLGAQEALHAQDALPRERQPEAGRESRGNAWPSSPHLHTNKTQALSCQWKNNGIYPPQFLVDHLIFLITK